MTDDPIDLDEHRGAIAKRATEVRRENLEACRADQVVLQFRQEEFEALILAPPASTWPEAAAKAQYLIRLFAATPEAQDPHRKKLIAQALDDLARLSDRENGAT